MSKRTVYAIERIAYSFSLDEVVQVLVDKGRDCRGNHLLPNPKVEWTPSGLSLVYEYHDKKDEAQSSPALPTPTVPVGEAAPWGCTCTVDDRDTIKVWNPDCKVHGLNSAIPAKAE